MPEIIKRGKMPEEVSYITQCRKCQTEFRFYGGESRMVRIHGSGGESYFQLEIHCPLCHHIVTVDPATSKEEN